MKTIFLSGLLLACASALVACGGSEASGGSPDAGDPGDGGTTGDGAADDAGDAGADGANGNYGAPSDTYPAFKPWMGQLANNGGGVLSNPVFVTITWPNDPSAATLEQFDDALATSAYWTTAVSEYGVGPATSGATQHVRLTTAPPAQMTDADIRNFIAQNVGGALPAPTTQTIYLVYLHPSTTLNYGGGSACQQGIGGYHNGMTAGGVSIAYGVVPRCGQIGSVTSAASHELGEAATDPHPNGRPGWVGFEDPYLVFELWQRNNVENGDACEFFREAFYTEQTPLNYSVQRLWSNKSGAAGHHPCVPVPPGPYFNVVPLDLQDITVDLSSNGGSASFKTKGYRALMGETITFPVGFYSDAATSGPFTVKAYESNPLVNPVNGRLTLSVDAKKPSGVNGERTYVTVTVKQLGPLKGEMLTLVATLGGVSHYMPVLIGSQ